MANKKIKRVNLNDTEYDLAVDGVDKVDGLEERLGKLENNTKSYTAGNGITISEDGTISVTFANYTGAFDGNGEIVSGYNISFATGNEYIGEVCYYSLDDGTTWNDFYDIKDNANPVLTNVTQIKFKTIRLGGDTVSLYWGIIEIPSLSIALSSSKGNICISDNIQLTNDVSDLTISYAVAKYSGGSDD